MRARLTTVPHVSPIGPRFSTLSSTSPNKYTNLSEYSCTAPKNAPLTHLRKSFMTDAKAGLMLGVGLSASSLHHGLPFFQVPYKALTFQNFDMFVILENPRTSKSRSQRLDSFFILRNPSLFSKRKKKS